MLVRAQVTSVQLGQRTLQSGPQGLQVFVERLVDLGDRAERWCEGTNIQQFHSTAAAPPDLSCVKRRLARPLEQVLVDVSVVSAEDRIQLLVVDVEGIHQGHGVGPHLVQELLNVSRNLHGLWNRQQSSLENPPEMETSSTQALSQAWEPNPNLTYP